MISLNKQQVSIRQFITRTFLEKGYEPTAKEIGEFAGVQIEETKKILKELGENKAIVLHPHTTEVWLAHPFSASPNAFWVQALNSNKGWWSNCTWCAMGISALFKQDVSLTSRWGGEGEQFKIEIKNGKLTNSNFVVHMALPVARLWDNVIHSCSLMLPFKNEDDINEWCKKHRIEKGNVISAEKCFELSTKWYGPYLDENWNRKGPEEVKAFFESIGLDLNFKVIK